MTARKPTTDTPDEATTGDATGTAPAAAETATPAGSGEPDLANAETTNDVEGATGTGIDGVLVGAGGGAPGTVDQALDDLKALGNAKPDVNVTAVQNGHGHWTWTARAAEDGRKLAEGGPHHADRLVENLQLLLGPDSTIALHATGLDKAKRLS